MPSTTTTASRPKGWIIATVVASCLAVAGIVAATVLGVRGPEASASTGPAQSSTTASGQYQPSTGDRGVSPAKAPKDRPATPVAAPSAAIKLLQQQLAQLNYYDGPITGYENTQTVNAITYLQRDAHLPQTGQLNDATRTALNSMLVHGNNQMAN